jgi:hypothetical protein
MKTAPDLPARSEWQLLIFRLVNWIGPLLWFISTAAIKGIYHLSVYQRQAVAEITVFHQAQWHTGFIGQVVMNGFLLGYKGKL